MQLPIHSKQTPMIEYSSLRRLAQTGCALLFVFCCAAAGANTLHVPADFPTIQQALGAAGAGDSILVAEGTFNENIVWPQTNGIRLLSDPANLSDPIIDGGLAGRVIDIDGGSDTGFNAEISGFVITHGFLDVPAHTGETGAGIRMNNGILRLSRCVISDNQITSSFAIQNNAGGAGVSIVGTPAGAQNVIEGCTFQGNTVTAATSGEGAAIYLDGAPAVIRRTKIQGNKISVNEVAIGMIYDYASDLVLESVMIERNRAQTNQALLPGFAAIKGTGLFSYLSSVTMTDCKIADNSALPQNSTLTLLGGAIYFYGEGTTLRVVSSSIAYNRRIGGAAVDGTAIYFSSAVAETAFVVNSILWNPGDGVEIDSFATRAAVRFTDVRDGTGEGTNLNVDPLFFSENDLHLQPGSACLNAGNNSYAPARDIMGHLRPLPAGTNVDLGCYEME
jgi:hypothetical protein